jgi:hypothetical protein
MKNQLIPYNEVEQFGKAMVASGFFEGVNQISQAIVKIQAGAEIGLPPFASMTGVHIIKGKPVLGANLIATLIKNDPRYDYRVQRLDDEACMIFFYEHGQKVGESEFTTVNAKAAGINNQNWQKFPRNMLFARAISNGAKWYTPGIFGGMPVYTPDEFGIPVDEEGDVLEGSYTPAPTPVEVQPQPVAKQPEPQPENDPDPDGIFSEVSHDFTVIRNDLARYSRMTGVQVVDAAVSTGLYTGKEHAENALKQNDSFKRSGSKLSAGIDGKFGLKLFDWLVTRKVEAELKEAAETAV